MLLGICQDVRALVEDPMRGMCTSLVWLIMLQKKVGMRNACKISIGRGNIVLCASKNTGVSLPLLSQLNSPRSYAGNTHMTRRCE